MSRITPGLYYDPLIHTWPTDKISIFNSCRVLIHGLGGLGLEVAKNLLQNGVEQLTLMDSKTVSYGDLSDFYSNLKEISQVLGRNRADEAVKVLNGLNPFAKVNVRYGPIDSLITNVGFLKEFNFVICTEQGLSSLVGLAQVCHDNGVKFVASDTKGLLSFIFCDLGEHKIKDLNPGFKEGCLIKNITNGNPTIIELFKEDEFCKEIYPNQYIVFRNVQGMVGLNDHKAVRVNSVKNSNRTVIVDLDSTNFGKFELGDSSAYFMRSRLSGTLSNKFNSLAEELNNISFRLGDPLKVKKREEIHHSLMQLEIFESEKKKLPRPYHEQDALEFIQYAQQRIPSQFFNEEICKIIAFTCQGKSAPFTTIIGALVAMEILKNLSMYYVPISQLDYIEAWDCLPSTLPSHEDCVNIPPEMQRYQQQIYLIGKSLQSKIMKSSEVIFGMGGLGWECLKNYALMGLSSDEEASTTLIDPKEASLNNLITHPFIREGDVSKFENIKTMIAIEYVRNHINPHMNIDIVEESVRSRSLDDDEEFFSWNSLESYTGYTCTIPGKTIVNLITPRAIGFSKRVIFATSEGVSGKVNLMIPHMTESYIRDTDEIKYHQIINYHASMKDMIRFSIDYPFKEMFRNDIAIYFNQFGNIDKKYIEFVYYDPFVFENSIRWAFIKFNEYFNKGITELYQTFFAPFMVNGTLPKYLSSIRRPVPVTFDLTNTSHLDFVLYSAVLRSKVYSIELPNMEDLKTILLRVLKEEGLDKVKQIDPNLSDEEMNSAIFSSLQKYEINLLNYDPNNELHLDFINACALVRAQCYKIPPIIDRHYIKRVSGLTPSSSIANSMTAGFATLQYYKFAQGSYPPIERFSDYTIDCTGKVTTESFKKAISTPEVSTINKGNETISLTNWNLIEINNAEECQDLTLKELIDKMKEEFSCETTSIDLKGFSGECSFSLFNSLQFVFSTVSPLISKMSSKLSQFSSEFNPDDNFVLLTISGRSLLDNSPITIPSLKFYLPSSLKTQ